MRLRWYLAVLVLAGIVPLVILTVAVTISLVRQERAAVERGLSDTANALAGLVENELEISVKSLETLATSQWLDQDELHLFYDQATRVRGLHTWTTIGLIDATGQHVLNLARPLGTELPDLRDRDYFKQVMATGAPYVSDLLKGRATGTLDLGVAVPVLRDGRVKYVLFAGVDPARFSQVFAAQNLPEPAIASIVSRDGVFIARSRDHAATIGHALPSAYLAQVRATPHGQIQRATVEGIAFESAYRRIPLTGWIVDFGMPTDVLGATARRTAWLGVLVGAAIVLGALAMVLTFARRMANDIRFVGTAASMIGRGVPSAQSSPLGVTELEEMRRFVTTADEALRERERQRTELLASEQAARADAEAAGRAKDQFLAMLGHELRNPLGAIAAAVGVLNALGTPDERAHRARGVISRQVEHLSRLVDDLLDVTRVTTGKVRLTTRPLDLGDLVANLAATWREALRFDRHEVVVDTEPTWVEGDETRLEQVVGNLVGNALKYTPADGRIVVRVRPDGTAAVLTVEDSGVGIPSHLLATVFDLFVQGDRALDRAQGGLGLGLTLVKALVILHGGTVQASSDGPGRGAVFTVRLPLVAAPPRPDQAPTVIGQGAGGMRSRVLLVEDNEDSREMLRMALDMAGHEVHVAADGLSGIAMATALTPDVALIDVGLPGMDGYDVVRYIRSTELGQHIRLVALTGYGQVEDWLRARDAGFDAHLTKPVAPERLLAVVGGADRPDRAPPDEPTRLVF
jgi:signal transduction histidine kinase/ActR/RegA family two-component response regulator